MTNKLVILVVVLMLVAVGAVYWFTEQTDKNLPQAHEFVGRIQKIDNNEISLKGKYQIEGDKVVAGNLDLDAVVTITPATKFTKTVMQYPTAEELKKTGGAYNPADLKREQVAGSIDDLKSGDIDGIYAKSDKNIYLKNKFTATEVTYIMMVYPK